VTVWGIVVAAGRGERFGGLKHESILGGQPMWEHSREALLAGGAGGVIVVGPVPGGVTGGERRRDSVAAGLAAVPADATIVLVHDAARPLASPDLVARVIERLSSGGADAVIPVVAVRDTIRRVRDGQVIGTVDRSDLAAVQTPQGFSAGVLRRAHAAGEADATDDAVLVERIGGTVVAVEGEPANIKVTYPADLALAEALLS